MTERTAEKLAEDSEGNVKAKNLTKTSGMLMTYLYEDPLIEYLEEDEQPHYVYSHDTKGFRITRANGHEETPHHGGGGKRYLLVTDQRVLYVVGHSEGDVSTELPYETLTDVEVTGSKLTGQRISLTDVEGKTYEFTPTNATLKACGDYVAGRIKEADTIDLVEARDDVDDDANHVIDATVAVFPESADEFTDVGGTEIVEQTDQSFHGRGPNTETYRYVNKRTVSFGDDDIEVGSGRDSATLAYEDVIDAELLRDKTVVDSKLNLRETDYLRLTVAKFACPHCAEFTGFAGDVRAHVEASSDDAHAGDAGVDHENRELIYLYFVGGHEGRVSRTYTSDIDVEHNFDSMPEPGGTAFGKARQELQRRCTNTESDLYILTDWIGRPGLLRIQGVQEGGSRITGGIAGRTESSGVTRGTQVGPFSRGTSKSSGSISASLEGRIEDNTFSSDIEFLQVDEFGLYVESDPVLDMPFGELDRVLPRDDGLLVEVGETTYSLTGKGYLTETRSFDHSDVAGVVDFIDNQIAAARETERAEQAAQAEGAQDESSASGGDQTTTEKLRDLKALRDEGILSDEEFESKKTELLDEF